MIGRMTQEQLEAFLETIPMEFSLVDADGKVVGWNRHETRIFRRTESVVGRDVRDCHPKKSLGKVEKILSEMKAGKRDRARFWIDLPIGPSKEPRKVLIEYHALRSHEGKYLGCLEVTQDITELQALRGQKRLLD